MRALRAIGSLLLVMGLLFVETAASSALEVAGSGGTRPKIAFTRTGSDEGVYTVSPDGSHLKRLTKGLDPTYFGGRYNPDWHPDGQKLVFAASRRGLPDRLYRINADGSALTRLTYPSKAGDSNPDYSPSGNRIALQHDSFENANLRRADADGSNRIRLTHRTSFEPEWAPDGTTILFAGRTGSEGWGPSQIFTIDPDGSNKERLTSGRGGQSSDYRCCNYDPVFSPDSSRIAYVSQQCQDPDGVDLPVITGQECPGDANIWVMDRDGSNKRQLTEAPGADFDPAWSPSGTSIAFVSQRDGNPEVYVMDATGDNEQRLTATRGPESDPEWSPGGVRIAYLSGRRGQKDIYVMHADGSNERRVTFSDDADEYEPVWRPADR